MGLGVALSTAVSSLKATQDALQITSQNIANANSENYTRREVVQENAVVNGVGAGVQVSEVRRSIDNFLVVSSRRQQSVVGQAEVKTEYFDRIDLYYGAPGQNNSLNIYTDGFFSSLTDLSATPEQASLRATAVGQAVSLAGNVSALAKNLEDTRFLADQEIATTLNALNQKLDQAHAVNVAIKEASITGADVSTLLDNRDALILDITNILDVTVNFDSDGAVSLGVPSGELLNPSSRFHLVYNQQTSVEGLINGDPISAINIAFLDDDGNATNETLTLKSSSTAALQVDNITGGRLAGLIEIRDNDIPKFTEQLDEFAQTLSDAFNALQNNGVGFPPATTLTGTTAVTLAETHNYTGSLTLAALNSDGSPVPDPYGTTGNLPPLNIDFDKLNGGSGTGTASVADIIKEINTYYGPPSAFKASVGGLDNFKLAAVSETVSSTSAIGTLVFGGQPATTALSSGAFDFSGGITASDTFTVGSHTFTFKNDGGPSIGSTIEIQGTDALTVAEIANVLNGGRNQAIFPDVGLFNFSGSGTTLSATSNTTGTANEGIVLSASVAGTVNPNGGSAVPAADTIEINGVTYTFVANGTAGGSFDNFIELGANLGATIDEIASVLNGSTSTELASAGYISNSINTLTVTHNQGTAGNSFTLNADFTNSANTVDINGNGALVNPAQDVLAGGGIVNDAAVEFDLEFFNTAGAASTFQILGVTADNGAVLTGALPTAESIAAGSRARTSGSFSLDFSGSTVAIGGTHNVSVAVQVTAADGTVTTETVTFEFDVPDTDVDIRNDRFDAIGISGTGDGSLNAVNDSSRFFTASLVDADGNAVTGNKEGFLKITSNQSGVGLAIDESTSKETGLTSDSTDATNRGVSHFFGLNDFFASDAGRKNSALTLNVRDAYQENTGLLATGRLGQSVQSSDTNADPIYTYEVGAGSNQAITALSDLKFARTGFDAAGGLPGLVVSFVNYAAEVINFVSLSSSTAVTELAQENILLSAFTDRIESTGGVNLDEELANTVVFQNNYTASARIINVISELFDSLIQAF
jgi:flagellar hook-associated protein FlgK